MKTPLLRRADQAVIASLTAVAIVGFAVWWLRAGGLRGERVRFANHRSASEPREGC